MKVFFPATWRVTLVGWRAKAHSGCLDGSYEMVAELEEDPSLTIRCCQYAGDLSIASFLVGQAVEVEAEELFLAGRY